MSNRFTVRVSVHLLLLNENKILLLRRFNTGYEDGKYSLVAGHIDGNESVSDAIIREAHEETGINIKKEDLEIVHVIHRKKSKGEYVDYFFKCTKWIGEIKNTEPHKCDDLSWYNVDNLPINMVDYVAYAIAEYKKNSHFSEFGWNQ